MRGIQQAVDVFFQAEDRRTARGGIAADAFKDADAIMQPGGDEGNRSLGEVFQFILDPDVL